MKPLTPILLPPESSGLAISAIPEEVHFPDFCSSDLPHIADRRRCTTPSRYTGSSLATTTHHRTSGDHSAPPRGKQGRDRTRPLDGLREFKNNTKLSNQIDNQTQPAPDENMSQEQLPKLTGYRSKCATIQPNHLQFKSLSNWSFNTAVGCTHGCVYADVPSTSSVKLTQHLKGLGDEGPEVERGQFTFLLKWDEKVFLRSLRKADRTPLHEVDPRGNRAVLYCSTTDPYQVIRHPDPKTQVELAEHSSHLVRRSLELIRDDSTLNVRILTRSPLASRDFDLFRSFGNRLVFGMSLPTLRNDLAKVYEPNAASPYQRLKTLQEAKEAGLHVFVAMAPTYPCERPDLSDTLMAIRELDPITVFHEPINIRAENVRRIEAHARSLGVTVRTDVFETRESWAEYALYSMYTVGLYAERLGMSDRLHLWPDKSQGSKWMLKGFDDPEGQLSWLNHWWARISEWPSAD